MLAVIIVNNKAITALCITPNSYVCNSDILKQVEMSKTQVLQMLYCV